MIVVDTNVISELTRQAPAPEVVSWLDSLAADEVATTAITAAELLYGVEQLPAGRRETELFQGRVLSFDEPAASRYAEIVARRERLGRSIGIADAHIAAVCRAIGAILATRNTGDFEDTGIDLINPWKPA